VTNDKARRKATQPWKVLESRYSFQDEWIRLRSETVQLPNDKILSPYHTLVFPEWVCAVVVTPAHDILLVEQYRHGAKQAMTELPAGTVEAGEEPLAAMQRELLEETGHASEEWHRLGTYVVNGARHTNRVHAFLALNARDVAPQRLDDGEVIHIHSVPWRDFTTQLAAGDLNFAACQLACLFWLQMFARGCDDPQVRQLSF
jgi:ADP-ribose pyrophosphatase